MIYSLDCGGHIFRLKLNQEATKRYFEGMLKETEDSQYEIFVTSDVLHNNPCDLVTNGSFAYLEFQYLMVKTGNELLKYRRCIYHGMCFLWKGKAWLFTGASGVGKSTQYHLWKQLEKDNVQIINGDKPILEIREQCVMVYNSPWKGKERLGNNIRAPLGGIILLEQNEINSIEAISIIDAVLPLFQQFISYPINTELLALQAGFLEEMLKSIPVWKLKNRGDLDSAVLTRSVLEKYNETI